jgi:hypothetical protein
MPVVLLIRRAWVGLLAALPRRVLGRLDGWARHRAQARAEKRRALLARRT